MHVRQGRMVNKKHIIQSLLFIALFLHSSLAGDRPGIASLYLPVQQLADSQQTVLPVQYGQNSSRHSTALIYSCVMPGAGQTMLGHTYKGLGFTLSAFGSLLTAVISHNNFVARGERLDALEFQYMYATNWVTADAIYVSMREAHGQMKTDKNRRDVFLAVAAIIWTANIVDVLYNTEDEGETMFSLIDKPYDTTLPIIASRHNPLLSISLRLP